jgi:hypothetical protein
MRDRPISQFRNSSFVSNLNVAFLVSIQRCVHTNTQANQYHYTVVRENIAFNKNSYFGIQRRAVNL